MERKKQLKIKVITRMKKLKKMELTKFKPCYIIREMLINLIKKKREISVQLKNKVGVCVI